MHSPSHPLDEASFEDIFFEELDSWFSADIACCDRCYQSFLRAWPVAFSADDAEFQKNQIQIGAFYDGSRINSFYSQEQFERLVRELDCPRCGEKFEDIIFPYNLPFDIPKDFEKNIDDIYRLANKTPFLLLKNAFAEEVFSTITRLAQLTSANKMPSNMFRARVLAGLSDFTSRQFDFADPIYVSEGRYNHAGNPALYLADSKETCFFEIRESVCVIAEISLDDEIRILDLAKPYDSHRDDSDLLNALVFSALLSTPQDDRGYQKPAYVFSRFIADCARSAGFDAIRYPSTRTSQESYNLVLLNLDFSIGKRSQIRRLFAFDGKRSMMIESDH